MARSARTPRPSAASSSKAEAAKAAPTKPKAEAKPAPAKPVPGKPVAAKPAPMPAPMPAPRPGPGRPSRYAVGTSAPGQEGAGQRIREARRAAGMTQDELAKAVGVSRSAVAQWETDRSGQVGGNLARIAGALGVAVQFLLTGSEPDDGPYASHGTELSLLRLYRACNEEDRAFLLRTAVRLARQATRESLEDE